MGPAQHDNVVGTLQVPVRSPEQGQDVHLLPWETFQVFLFFRLGGNMLERAR